MDVSVIVVNYNTKDLTINCIKSVLASKTLFSYEIILVDNASSDGSVETIQTLYPEVKVIANKQNIGFGRANNMGAKLSAGRYLYILNSDTEISNDVIDKVVTYGDKNPDVGVIGTRVIYPDGRPYCNFYKFQTFLSEVIFFTIGLIKSKDWSIFHLNKYRNFPRNESFAVDVISGCSLFVKREVYEKIGLFNENFFMYYEDGEFCYRVKKNGFKSVYLPTSLVKHFHMGTSKMNIKDFRHVVYCFKSACIYIECIKNSLYASVFKMICSFAWFNELILMRLIFIIKKNNKLKQKISMLHALLNG